MQMVPGKMILSIIVKKSLKCFIQLAKLINSYQKPWFIKSGGQRFLETDD